MGTQSDPLLTFCYVDPEVGAKGYLVIDRLINGLCAGGLRIQPTVDLGVVTELARNMTLKQAVAGIHVGGAKAGLALDPTSPVRPAVLRRFLEHLRPYILDCYSVGPDMNTTLSELEAAARDVGVPALKIAVGRRRGMSDDEFLSRYRLFEEQVEEGTVNQLRASTAVVAAVMEVARVVGKANGSPAVAIQGAGNIGGAAARLLSAEGAKVVAWSDDQKCLRCDSGLDIVRLLAGRANCRLPSDAGGTVSKSSDLLRTPCDVLVLGAVSRAVTTADLPRLGCRSIVVGANLGLEPEVEQALHAAGVPVVPDLVASSGGSLAVEALYALAPRTGRDVLEHVKGRAGKLARDVIVASRAKQITPRAVALGWAENNLQSVVP